MPTLVVIDDEPNVLTMRELAVVDDHHVGPVVTLVENFMNRNIARAAPLMGLAMTIQPIIVADAKREGRSIIIKADRLAPYELVAAVTNAALEHGITSVALAATPSICCGNRLPSGRASRTPVF